MDSELVEEFFAELLAQPTDLRDKLISESDHSSEVKEAASRLCRAHESKSRLLNKDLLSDIARVAPDFFESENDGSTEDFDVQLKRGERIGDYVVEKLIGSGGMSIVYRAIQTQPIKRRVALKFIRPSLFAPKTVKRFFREQQAIALVDHANIATLYEVGMTKAGHPFAAMEYVKGLPITEFCQKYQLNTRQRLRVFMRACDGLFHAHRHGIVHRDIKPDNMLVGVSDRRPHPKLIDFGIAKISREDLNDNLTMTQFGQILGSPRYMSPEQFSNGPIDQRTDLYSAALVLFELLTNDPFRDGETTEEIINQVKSDVTMTITGRLTKRTSSVEEGSRDKDDASVKHESFSSAIENKKLNWILQKALARDPDERYPDIREFVQDIDAAMKGQPVSVSGPGWVARAKQTVGKFIKPIAVAAIAVVAGALAFGYFAIQNSSNDLVDAKRANTESVQQTAAANDLIMRLLASDMYELSSDKFDLNLIPAYESQYDVIHSNGGPKSKEEKTVYGILAVLNAMSGDFDRADALMNEVVDDQTESELRQVREKICAQYAATAKEKLALLDDENDSFEKASEQMTLGRCYIVWGMLDDAESLLNNAIRVFGQTDPNSYECVVARVTLAKIYEKAGKVDRQEKLLVATYENLKENHDLLATQRGQVIREIVMKTLIDFNPMYYGHLGKILDAEKVN